MVDTLAHRLQIQERLTVEIAEVIERVLKPLGVAVVVEAVHACRATRGVHKEGITMVTSKMLRVYKDDDALRAQFLDSVRSLVPYGATA